MSDRVKKLKDNISQGNADKVPPGWQTLREIAKDEGRDPETLRRILREAEEKKLIKSRIYRIHTGPQLRNVRHWKL